MRYEENKYNQKKATIRVMNWLAKGGDHNKTLLSEKLRMSRPTLNVRIENDSWTYFEIQEILNNL